MSSPLTKCLLTLIGPEGEKVEIEPWYSLSWFMQPTPQNNLFKQAIKKFKSLKWDERDALEERVMSQYLNYLRFMDEFDDMLLEDTIRIGDKEILLRIKKTHYE